MGHPTKIPQEFRGHLIFWSENWNELLDNSQRIPKEFPKNSQKIPQKISKILKISHMWIFQLPTSHLEFEIPFELVFTNYQQ